MEFNQTPTPEGNHTCPACEDLRAEVGPELFAFYRVRLLVQGWAGNYSPRERSYVRAHRSPARQQAAAARAQRLRTAISNRLQKAVAS